MLCALSYLWLAIRYWVFLHVVLFALGMFDFVRIPHIPNWRQLFWTIKFGLLHPSLSLLQRFQLLCRQAKVLIAFTLIAPVWMLEEMYFYRRVKMPQMVFIICTPRTGSTNLHRIMSRDKRIIAPTLTNLLAPFIILWTIADLIGIPDVPQKVLQKFITFLNGNYNDIHRFHDTGVNVVEEMGICTLSQWFSEMIMPPYLHPDVLLNFPITKFPPYLKTRILDYTEIVLKKFAYINRNQSVPIMLCKGIEPFLWDISELEKRFPGAKFITLTRDPKKQLCSRFSFYEAQQKISHGIDLDPRRWGPILACRTREGCEFVMKYFLRTRRKDCLALTFADFVNDLPATYAKIYDFIGLKYEGTDFADIVKKEVEEHENFKGSRKYKNIKFEEFSLNEDKFNEMFGEYYTYCS